MNPEVEADKEKIALLVQRDLVLLEECFPLHHPGATENCMGQLA